jgi:hypothetical protein
LRTRLPLTTGLSGDLNQHLIDLEKGDERTQRR